MKRLTAILLFIGGATALPARGESEQPPPRSSPTTLVPFPQQFNILLTRSIFARDGLATTRPGPETQPSSQPSTSLVLRGVVIEDGTYTAIFEDPASHQIQRVKEGSPFAGGRIGHMTLRSVELTTGDQSTQVALGHDLRGELVAPPPVPVTAVAKGQPPHTPPGQPGNPPPNSPDAVQAAATIEGTRSANATVVEGGVAKGPQGGPVN